jgi:hypothetical protein
VLYLACCQLIYPWVGVLLSLRYALDRKTRTFAGEAGVLAAEPAHLWSRSDAESQEAAPRGARS